ncbi:MAG: hypothetical protein ACIAQF_07170 [Phycisphaerales bacterium JB065]
MREPVVTDLDHRLDAWGRAELHSASKQLSGPPPGFIKAVGAEARLRRTLNRVILLALLLLVIALGVVAYFRANPPVTPSEETPIRTLEGEPLRPLSFVR